MVNEILFLVNVETIHGPILSVTINTSNYEIEKHITNLSVGYLSLKCLNVVMILLLLMDTIRSAVTSLWLVTEH